MDYFKNRTGTECKESSWYYCEDHPAVEEFVKKGDFFPSCKHVAGHPAKWVKMD